MLLTILHAFAMSLMRITILLRHSRILTPGKWIFRCLGLFFCAAWGITVISLCLLQCGFIITAWITNPGSECLDYTLWLLVTSAFSTVLDITLYLFLVAVSQLDKASEEKTVLLSSLTILPL